MFIGESVRSEFLGKDLGGWMMVREFYINSLDRNGPNVIYFRYGTNLKTQEG